MSAELDAVTEEPESKGKGADNNGSPTSPTCRATDNAVKALVLALITQAEDELSQRLGGGDNE